MNLRQQKQPYGYSQIVTSKAPEFINIDINMHAFTFHHLKQAINIFNAHIADDNVISFYTHVSEDCGGDVVVDPQTGCLPYILGSDNQPVFLYKFVEILDEYIGYDQIKTELPTLSYGQISGALSFLRKLVQFNIRNINIDDLEDAELESSHDFQSLIENSLSEEGVIRVPTSK